MRQETNPKSHSEPVHPQVLAVFAHYGVTVEDYLLFTSGSILPKNGEFPRALTDPIMEADCELEANVTYEEAYAEFEDIFVDDYLQELLDAKHTFIQELLGEDCNVEVQVDDDTLLDLDMDLPAVQTLGVSLEAMTVFEFQTAFESGILMGERADEPEQLGRALAIGYYLCPDPEAYERWLTVALYSMGKAIYEIYDELEESDHMEDDSKPPEYTKIGFVEVQKHMEEFLGAAIKSDSKVTAVNTHVFDGLFAPKDAVAWYETLAKHRETSHTGYYPDPEVDESIFALLDEHGVTWDELQFTLGGSIVSKMPSYFYSFPWFSDLLRSQVIDIAKDKNDEAIEALNQCAELLGYQRESIGFFSRWDVKVLMVVFNRGIRRLSSDPGFSESEPWSEIERGASLSYIVSHAFEKAHSYLTLQNVILQSDLIKDPMLMANTSYLSEKMSSLEPEIMVVAPETYKHLTSESMREIFGNAATDRSLAYRITKTAAENLQHGGNHRGSYTSVYS